MSDTAPDTADTAPPPLAAFDLAALDLLGPSNEGKPLELRHPSGLPYRISTGEVATITLKGRHSDAARALLKQLGDEIAELEAAGRPLTEDLKREHDTRYLCAVTLRWNIERLDGQPFLVTPQNVERLWTDPRFAHLRGRALNFIAADGLFLPVPA